ncbi:MAG: hypothetical protein J6Y33_03155 [Prevotella sp.]|nr:hypothetical protein [Prevotella sp.]
MGTVNKATPKPLHFGLFGNVDPKKELTAGLNYYLGEKHQWLPAYDGIVEWLADNKGRGLIAVGSCGLGKSLICTQILPVLFRKHFDKEVKNVTALEMNSQIDDLLAYCAPGRIVIVDDLGTEPVETVFFGNRRKPFCELVDKAERTGTLLIITTNLRTTKDNDLKRNYPSIETRYGMPTLDRLRAITRVVVFKGGSMRPRG